MDHDQAKSLERAIQQAISKSLRAKYPHKVSGRIQHLMAKAAVAVLEATAADESRPKREKVQWNIDAETVARVKAFFEEHRDNPFVRERIARNLSETKSPVTIEEFWYCMIVCLLTTQQKSGPKYAVTRFAKTKPFPLNYVVCSNQQDLAGFVTETLTNFRGIRRTKTIGKEAASNMTYLQNDGWQETTSVLESVRKNPTREAERDATRFIDDKFRGFGPKQSRNLLQGMGLSRYEIPIDSRIAGWLVEFGFPVEEDASALTNRTYYEFVLNEFQRLCAACGIIPCVLDAAIFSSVDDGGWDEDNPYWLGT